MKVRIGNDIKLTLALKNTKDDVELNVHSAKAYIINNSRKLNRRFITEPCTSDYVPTEYNINGAGSPHFIAYPHNTGRVYTGFGLHPDWNYIYGEGVTGIYQAEVSFTSKSDEVTVFFPAEAQLTTGSYSIIIIAQLYTYGYRPNNLRTITVDYPNVFELVKTSEDGVDGIAEIIVEDSTDSRIKDIYVSSGQYGDNNITLNLTDGNTVNINTSEITSWYEGD